MRGVLIDAAAGPGAETAASGSSRSAGAAPFDPEQPWQRARSVALRPEPFGALVYHFGNRKLSFLKSKTLVRVVETLADQPTASATLAACEVPEAQRPAYLTALADLARSQMIERRTPFSSPLAGSGPASERGHGADPEAHR